MLGSWISEVLARLATDREGEIEDVKGPEMKRSARLTKEFGLHSSNREYIRLPRKEMRSTVKHTHSGT